MTAAGFELTFAPDADLQVTRASLPLLVQATQLVQREVARLMPPAGDDERRGHFASRVSVQQRNNAVYTRDSWAHLVEFGTIAYPPYAPFRRGAENTFGRLSPAGAHDREVALTDRAFLMSGY